MMSFNLLYGSGNNYYGTFCPRKCLHVLYSINVVLGWGGGGSDAAMEFVKMSMMSLVPVWCKICCDYNVLSYILFNVTFFLGNLMNPASEKGIHRCFCVRMKSTLTKRGVHVKCSGYRVSNALPLILSVE